MTGAILMREGPNEHTKTSEQKTKNKINRKSSFKKNQMPFN